MRLVTGMHERKYCPVWLPDTTGADVVMVTIGDRQVLGQRVGSRVCCILPEASAGGEFTVSQAPAAALTPTVVLTDQGNGLLDVTINGEPFTTYHYAGEGNRPFCWPVLGPGGVKMTRNYPMIPDVPGESKDHPHQRSLYTAFGDVNGHDDWSQEPGAARIAHRRFTAVESGPVCGRLVEELDWVTDAGALLMTEEREIVFYNTPADHRLLDWRVTMKASAGAVRLGDTKEGGILALRVNCELEAPRGVIENGWGAIGEAECWGKPAPWCDYSGMIDGTHAGIAVFDWRENPGFPTNWHVRGYGLMTANIFGQRSFHGEDYAFSGERLIQAGASLEFAYRVFIHAGNAGQAGVAGRYLDFAYPPAVE